MAKKVIELIAHLGHSEESPDHLLTLTHPLGGEAGGGDGKEGGVALTGNTLPCTQAAYFFPFLLCCWTNFCFVYQFRGFE